MSAASGTSADVVVVGAGTAGAVVAARLSEDADRQVVLCEAAPDRPPTPAVAGQNFLAALARPELAWPGPQLRRAAHAPEQTYVRARVFGGGSAINAHCGLWGQPADYGNWGIDRATLARWRGVVERQLPLCHPPREQWSPFEQAAVDAALELGYPWCADANAADTIGVGPAPLTISDQRRNSTADAYLATARARPNLQVWGSTTVAAVQLEGRRATGVVLANGEVLTAGRVVVCAGALGSPALLAHSGVAASGLGEHLVDHPSVTIAVPLVASARPPGTRDRVFNTVLRYSSGLGGSGLADMQILLLGASGVVGDAFATAVAQVAVMESYGEGRVRPGPDGQPLVDYDQLADGRDRVRLRDGVRRLVDLLAHPSLAGLGAGGRPAGAAVPVDDRNGLDRWLEGNGGSYFHAMGTARLGDVTDHSGAVTGYEGLHVIDASVIPPCLRANPMLSIVLAAEALTANLRSRS